MSRQFRLRAAGVVLGALFIVGPMVMNGTAQAEMGHPGGHGGKGVGKVGRSCAVEHRSERFHHRVEVLLKPDCAAAGAPPVLGTPGGSQSSLPPAPPPPTSAAPTSAAPTASPSPTRPPVTIRPKPPKALGNKPRPANPTPAATNDDEPRRPADRPRPRTDTASRTAAAASPSATPTATERPLELDLDPAADGPVLAAPEIDDDAGADDGAAAPVAALEPTSQDDSLGLLALAATICLAGVTAAAIRAIVAQRASRATIA